MTAFIVSIALAVTAPVPKDADERFTKDVNAARVKAIDFFKKQQDKEGTWEGAVLAHLADMNGGVTALATLSLLEAGVPANDPVVAKAVAYLVKLEPKKTYVVSLQTQVLCRVDAKKHGPQIQKNVDWLIEKAVAVKEDGKLNGWSYQGNDRFADGSNTHFAVMALHAAAQAGAKVDTKVWNRIHDLYSRTQLKDGWAYLFVAGPNLPPPTLSMTTCGLLGLTIAARYGKNAKGPDPAFEKGMAAWFKLGPGTNSEAYEWMAIAELGRALGETEFRAGKEAKAWYREGAEKLVRTQKEDGSWEGQKGIDRTAVYATACALYLLGPPAKK